MTRIRKIFALALSGSLLASCDRPAPANAEVEFLLHYAGQVINCETIIEDGTKLTDLRFYVAEATLMAPATNPTDSVQLLDFENAAGACINGSITTSTRLQLQLPAPDYQGLAFTVGVPFARNHQDPLKAAPPLNLPAMHWHWRSGYKFLRAGVIRNGRRWHVHLGSTGCEGPITAVSHCQRPNRARIELPEWQPGDAIVIDLDQLLHGVQINDQTAAHCQAQVDIPACRSVAANLGLNPDTGMADRAQRVFRVMGH